MFTKTVREIPNDFYPKKITIYQDPGRPARALILYFHGGGLLYGNREDLPSLHLDTFTDAGCVLVAYDYPLAPAADLTQICDDVVSSIRHCAEKCTLPYFLMGRSAGAYLCLLAGAKGGLHPAPSGILSFYGYGFLTDGWFQAPSSYYSTLPPVQETILTAIPDTVHAWGDLDTHFSVYVYARQQGKWIDLIYRGRQKFFYLDYTLRSVDVLPCPLFCAHAMNDPDVPYAEFVALCDKYQARRFIASGDIHDFDRDEDSVQTKRLLSAALEFIESKLSHHPIQREN